MKNNVILAFSPESYPNYFWSSRLGQQNTPTASLQRGKTPPNECPGYDMKQSDGQALGNAEYPFIAIALSSTLTQSGSTW